MNGCGKNLQGGESQLGNNLYDPSGILIWTNIAKKSVSISAMSLLFENRSFLTELWLKESDLSLSLTLRKGRTKNNVVISWKYYCSKEHVSFWLKSLSSDWSFEISDGVVENWGSAGRELCHESILTLQCQFWSFYKREWSLFAASFY